MKDKSSGHRGESMYLFCQASLHVLTILQDVQIQAIQDMDSEVWSSLSADIVSRDLCFYSPRQWCQTRRGKAG